MHSTELGAAGGNVPAFLTKLMRLVEDPNCDDLICWNVDGTSFFIHDQTRFARELLPMYFKHNNMQSFIRQLNMYGFRKKQLADQGGLKCESDTMEFYHQYFLKGQETLLEYIKRKVSVPTSTSRGGTTSASNNSLSNTDSSADVMHEILTDVRAIRGKQESVDSLLNDMKRENEALWREVAFLRQKHMKQQQVVEKLIQFLVTLVQPGNRNINVVQRKLPLMLYDSSVNNSNNSSASSESPKIGRFTRQYSNQAQNSNNSTGPVIRDVTDSLESRVAAESVPSPINQRLLNPEFCEAQQSRESPLPEQPIVNSPSVDSPLNTEEIMEPLSVLVPLQTPTNTILMLPTGNDVMENEFLNSPTAADPTLEDLVDSETNNNDGKETLSPQPPSSTSASRSDPPSNVPLVSEKNNLIIPDLIESPTPSTSNNPQMTVALNEQPSISFSLLSPGYKRFDIERSSFTDHLEGIDNELDWLSEQLSGNSYSIDTSNLLGLFGADDTVPGNNLPTDSFRFTKGDVTGNEVVQYLPNLMETESAAANEKDLVNDLETTNEDNSDLTSSNDCIAELLGVSQEELFRNLMVRNQSDNRAATQLQYISNLQQNPPKDSNFEIPRTIQRKKTAPQSSLRAKKKKTS